MRLLKNFKDNQTWIEEHLYFHDTTNQANNVRLVYYVESGEFVYLGKFLFFAYCTAFQPNKSLDGKHIPWHISDSLNELIHQFGWLFNANDYYRYFMAGKGYVQNVFHYLDVSQRELILTGIHPECWDELMGEEEEEEEDQNDFLNSLEGF